MQGTLVAFAPRLSRFDVSLMCLTLEIKWEPLHLRSFRHLELLLEQLVLIQTARHRRLIGPHNQAFFPSVLTLSQAVCYATLC